MWIEKYRIVGMGMMSNNWGIMEVKKTLIVNKTST